MPFEHPRESRLIPQAAPNVGGVCFHPMHFTVDELADVPGEPMSAASRRAH